MKSSEIYLRFLAISDALNQEMKRADVDLTSQKLLEAIAVAAEKKKMLTVSQAMALEFLGSPATLHRKLQVLMDAGLIEQTFEGRNRRTRFLCPTERAQKYFEKMGKSMTSIFTSSLKREEIAV
jgi:DNA-binding MarR family transcriptional regulator